ncbi:MAG: hypothetical protein K2X37_07990 [Chitinophagaceae bacterium]|nr:hypothetical protein [Chitinophagaceae bacterium]
MCRIAGIISAKQNIQEITIPRMRDAMQYGSASEVVRENAGVLLIAEGIKLLRKVIARYLGTPNFIGQHGTNAVVKAKSYTCDTYIDGIADLICSYEKI